MHYLRSLPEIQKQIDDLKTPVSEYTINYSEVITLRNSIIAVAAIFLILLIIATLIPFKKKEGEARKTLSLLESAGMSALATGLIAIVGLISITILYMSDTDKNVSKKSEYNRTKEILEFDKIVAKMDINDSAKETIENKYNFKNEIEYEDYNYRDSKLNVVTAIYDDPETMSSYDLRFIAKGDDLYLSSDGEVSKDFIKSLEK